MPAFADSVAAIMKNGTGNYSSCREQERKNPKLFFRCKRLFPEFNAWIPEQMTSTCIYLPCSNWQGFSGQMVSRTA